MRAEARPEPASPPWALLAACVALSVGVVWGTATPDRALAFTAATLVAIAAAGVVRDHRRWAAACLLAVVVFAGAADGAWRKRGEDAALLPKLAADGAIAEACGIVVERRPRSIEVDVREVRLYDRAWRTRERVRMPAGGARAGERVCGYGSVSPPRTRRDEPPFLGADETKRLGVGAPVRFAAGVVRQRFSEAARDALPDTQAGLLLGMTDGDVALLDERTLEEFRTTGLAHLVAVSGSNVAVVLAVVVVVARLLIQRGRWLRVLCALPPLVFFAFLTALEASVLRAVVTAGLVLVVAATGRVADGLRIAAGAFALLVLASPELLWSVGFQLSFGATLGLIVFARPLTDRLLRVVGNPAGVLPTVVGAAVATTLAAQVAVAPLLAVHFGRVPALGGIANLIVAPLAPVVMVGGMTTLGVASLWSVLAWAPASLRLVLDAILWVARTFAALPAASVGLDAALGVALVAVLAAGVARSSRVRLVAVALVVACAGSAMGGAVVRSGSGCGATEIRALDVGQGTAVLLRDEGHAVLVDGGPRSGGVATQLRDLGVGRLDAVFASHPHADHVEGEIDVLQRLDVGMLLGPQTMRWGVGAEVAEVAERAGVAVRETVAGDVHTFGPRIRVEVISPPPGPAPPRSEDAVNDYSLVLRATVDGLAALLPGDVDADAQIELLGAPLSAPVLVAPHHGSADVHRDFVEAVASRVVVVTVGENRYGHPTARAMRLYARRGPVLRTDEAGAVSLCVRDGMMEVNRQR